MVRDGKEGSRSQLRGMPVDQDKRGWKRWSWINANHFGRGWGEVVQGEGATAESGRPTA